MLIALYSNHHHLPFWHNTGKPYALFSENFFKEKKPWGKPHKAEGTTELVQDFLTKENPVSVFLLGLQKVKADHLMAHVSAFCNTCAGGEHYHYPHRVWVQISTRPKTGYRTFNDPLANILSGLHNLKNEVLVDHVWGGDNQTYGPFEFIKDGKLRERSKSEPELWTRFFIEKLGLDPVLVAAQNRVDNAEVALKKIKIFE